MKAAIRGIVVLGGARRAHGKACHRRQRAVVGDVAHDGESRPAVGAVDERVAEPPVGGIGEFAQAVLACGTVGRDQGAALPAAVARRYREPSGAVRLDHRGAHPLDAGKWRCVVFERGKEVADPWLGSLDLDEDAACVVADMACQAQSRGQRVHERAEAHSLHDALHADERPDVPVHLHSLSRRSFYWQRARWRAAARGRSGRPRMHAAPGLGPPVGAPPARLSGVTPALLAVAPARPARRAHLLNRAERRNVGCRLQIPRRARRLRAWPDRWRRSHRSACSPACNCKQRLLV